MSVLKLLACSRETLHAAKLADIRFAPGADRDKICIRIEFQALEKVWSLPPDGPAHFAISIEVVIDAEQITEVLKNGPKTFIDLADFQIPSLDKLAF